MKRALKVFVVMFIGVAAANCVSAWPAQQTAILPGSGFGDSAIDGAYRWIRLDGKSIPVEFPEKSGRRLVYGTLDLSNAPAARNGNAGKFSQRTTVQPPNDTVRIVSASGTFSLAGDTIRLSSGDVFRFSWRPNGDLVLTDGANHAWVYTRR